ncbi:endolytic transglycosylase MltG [Methylomonas paludis]|uniref:Endolytic murein transglycosylase n=1 Tax=Methylomonas paludis TaxID=1173101 RepID=A0A975RAQ6_9GAMM|nr:endolytic transglycosylase MltG [Methylomonas paludis]QWF71481.1 endolytic transglycosylase MltG [Methylomonas paludis]
MGRSIVAFTILMVVGLLLVWGSMHNQLILKKSLITADTVFEIKKGDSLDSITRQLQAQHIDIHPLWFKLFAYRHHLGHLMKAGEYQLKKGATAADILQLFADGKTRQYAITFPEGWAFKQVFQAIKNNPNLQHTISDENLHVVMAAIGSDKNYPEGLFFPDTYFFEKNTSDVELLKRAHDKMQQVLATEWEKRDQAIPLENPYQALILASIVEKETAAREERKQIAGVFTRRLKKGMLLQTDPTVIYGMGDEYHGDIRLKDLRQPTPYNTYIIEGLPPTPIAMPGKEAIVAALHPDNNSESLYFVARGDGRHMFSSTLAEHEKYVDRYQR